MFCEPLPEHAQLSAAERAAVKARQGVELVSSGEMRVWTHTATMCRSDGRTLGEICVRGNVVMKGYFNDQEATAAAFNGGWIHTGDAAVVHPEGYVEIRDRFKDVIISAAVKTFRRSRSRACLLAPSRRAGSRSGRHAARELGRGPHAFVVLRKARCAPRKPSCGSSRAENLAHFKVPQWVSFVTELPKTATGKIQKFVLRGRSPGIVAQ